MASARLRIALSAVLAFGAFFLLSPGRAEAGCNPKSCNALHADCGNPADGCGGTVYCGACTSPNSCDSTYKCSCTPKTCAQLGYSCGTVDNGCGTTLNCGTCSGSLTCSSASHSCVSSCTPATCASLGATCGSVSDGCGGTLSCGTCGSGLTCNASNQCACAPTTCAALGAECGTPSNGCGSNLSCGSCNGNKSCNGSYQCVTGGCTATTCAALGAVCGSQSDGCGGTLSCGTCGSGQSCSNGQCVAGCTPTTCAAIGAACGSPSDGCGGTLSCGSCSGNKVCDNTYKCVNNGGGNCTPLTCADLGANCGPPSDGCGGTITCGTCPSGQSCSYGNVCVASTTVSTVGSTFAAGALVIPMDQCYQKTDGSAAYAYDGTGACVAAATPTCHAANGYPDGDIRHAFGLIYLLASNNIPVHIILKPDKTALADADFTVTAGGATPAASYLAYANGAYTIDASRLDLTNSTSMSYLGMPFIVDATFAQQALAVIHRRRPRRGSRRSPSPRRPGARRSRPRAPAS